MVKDLNVHGYIFLIDQLSVNWKEIFNGKSLTDQIIIKFEWPSYILENIAILYAMFNFILFPVNVRIKFYSAFSIHKAIEKQARMTEILLTGILGIFSHTLTQLIVEAQNFDNITGDSDNISYESGNNNTISQKAN